MKMKMNCDNSAARKWILAAMALWTVIFAVIILIYIFGEKACIQNDAVDHAKNTLEKDVLFRKWCAQHGGVYVPVTESTQPNPYIPDTFERNIKTISGKQLTLVNPAYMMRQLSEIAEEENIPFSHITSLKPVRPGNAPDDWEKKALAAFETGEKEVVSVDEIEGVSYIRIMRPLITEKPCLKCHAAHGYKEGDIRGGISAKLTMQPFIEHYQERVKSVAFSYMLIWLIGMFGIVLSGIGLNRSNMKRLQAEAMLRKERDMARNYFDIAGVLLVILNTKGEIVAINRRGQEILGCEHHEITGMNWIDNFIPEKLREDMWSAFRKIISGDSRLIEHYENLVLTMRGEERTIKWHYALLHDEAGNIIGTLSSGEDITEHKEMQKYLFHAIDTWSNTFDTINDIITVHDRDFNIIQANRAASEILGISIERILSQKCFISYHGLGCPPAGCPSCMTLKNGTPTVTELFEPHLGRHIEIKAIPKTDETGQITGLIHVVRDISERKEKESALRAAKEAAESAVVAKSRFLSNMSHEIRTPMNGIIGMTELALDTDLTAEQKDYIETVKQSSYHMLGLLNEILDLAKIESGAMTLEETDFDIRQLMRSVIASQNIAALNEGLVLYLDIEPGVPEILRGDPLRLKQVLINLLGNAIKFTGKGIVSASVRNSPGADGDSCPQLLFSVKDSGVGIPADKLDMIFEPFSQADNTITRKYGGTGLGLSICKQLVSMMGGTMWVESKVGIGSVFYFTAKFSAMGNIAEEDALPSEAAEYSKYRPLNTLEILLVEDNPVNQKVAAAILEKQGHSVIIANNGREALDTIQLKRFDLVLMDIQMPEMDGFETAKRIRSFRDAVNNIPIIAMTACAMEGDREKCLAGGMNDYISKPLNVKELFRIIETYTRNNVKEEV